MDEKQIKLFKKALEEAGVEFSWETARVSGIQNSLFIRIKRDEEYTDYLKRVYHNLFNLRIKEFESFIKCRRILRT